jgi:hypothetical protein
VTSPSGAPERRWDKGAWLTLAIALSWLLVELGLALYALYIPSDGWMAFGPDSADGSFSFEFNLTGQPSALQAGDILHGIDGQRLSAERTPQFPPRLEVGQTLRYSIERGTQLLEIDVVLVTPGAMSLLRGLATQWQRNPRDLIIALVSVLVVGAAFGLRPGNLGARYLLLMYSFYFCIILGYGLSSLFTYTYPWPLRLLYNLLGPWVWGWYFFPTITLMALAFPVVKRPLRRFPRLLPGLLYGVPLVITAAANYTTLATGETRWLAATGSAFLVTSLLTVMTLFATMIHNWRTLRDPIARAQLRWLTLGLGAGLGLMFSLSTFAVLWFGRVPESWNNTLWLMILLPISMAMAITRYRLFDIDVIVRRTLVYSLLTTLLALAYFGSVLMLQPVFGRLTGNAQSPLVVVLSTLAVAALFFPLRHRVQAFIDRRFFRQKYDAARTLAAFAGAARDETDLARLNERLVEVVAETVQPRSVGLWLRKDKAL